MKKRSVLLTTALLGVLVMGCDVPEDDLGDVSAELDEEDSSTDPPLDNPAPPPRRYVPYPVDGINAVRVPLSLPPPTEGFVVDAATAEVEINGTAGEIDVSISLQGASGSKNVQVGVYLASNADASRFDLHVADIVVSDVEDGIVIHERIQLPALDAGTYYLGYVVQEL